MPTPTKGRRLGGSAAHQRHMLANLATALFEHGKITTTEARARRLRPVAERLITFAKRGDLHARRQVLTTVTDKSVVHALFAEIGPSFAGRSGGYTRITKIGPRKGDNAAMAVVELIREEATARPSRRRARRSRPAAAAGAVAGDTAAEAAEEAAEPAGDAAGAAGAAEDQPPEAEAEAPETGAAAGDEAGAAAQAGADADDAGEPARAEVSEAEDEAVGDAPDGAGGQAQEPEDA